MAIVGAVNFGGLASGLDTKALIDAIMKAERRPLTRLESKQATINAKKSALDEMRSKLVGFLDTLRGLSADNTFRARTAVVSDESFIRAKARPGAETGLFAVEIFELAVAHKVKSEGMSSADLGLVSAGTITIQSGDNDPITVDVSSASGNNSLEGVRDAINNADAGVQASVLFDGSDYRLVVRAQETGLSSALAITDSTNLGLDDPANEVATASDARLEVDGIEITSSSNRLTSTIRGVTLDLLAPTTGVPTTLQIDKDSEAVVGAVQSLVKEYNGAIEYFNQQFDTDDPGPLGGDGTARRIQLRLQSLVTGGLEGIPAGGIRSLSSIGISFDGRTAKMSLNTARLEELLDERFDDVSSLFIASGTSTDPRVQFVSSTAATQAGEYGVEITAAAERASVVGSAAIRASGIGGDETLTVTVNSQQTAIDLTRGMDITEVVDTVNAALDSAGLDATAFDDGGALRLTSNRYGSEQTVSVVSSSQDPGNGRQSGFDTTPATDSGEDVAGRIGGVDATASGQFLKAAEGEPFEGLSLRITATAADIAATGGDLGTISFSPGVTENLTSYLEDVTRFGDGTIDFSRDVLESELRRISDDIERLEDRLTRREARLVQIFTEAERAISALQAQQSQIGSFT